MSTTSPEPEGPDLARGVPIESLPDGEMLVGHVDDDRVMLVRRGDEVFALGASCTHYGAPLEDGMVVGDTVRCPWHHASFCLRTGAVRRAPALDALPCWRVEQRDGNVYVLQPAQPSVRRPAEPSWPKSVVIIGGGAAGNAAAETLRKEGYSGKLTMLSADKALPCDRPNLSKGFLAGSADDDSNILRSAEFYAGRDIDVRLEARVTAIDPDLREVLLADGSRYPYDALLLATGAEPVKLGVPGSDLAHVHYLRTVDDARALVARALTARRAVVIGASFIGLEVAAALRARGLEVDVVGPERIPMERVLGSEVGSYIRGLHESHGATFHLETTVTSIAEQSVTLANGATVDADLVVVGIGVRPAVGLAEQTGLAIDKGVKVDAYLETSTPGVFAAGDIARWPDLLSGDAIRVEHWVVAERQGQTAARNILGRRERFDCVPFFWTEQYDFGLGYVGHGDGWDAIEIDGQLESMDCTVTYLRNGRKVAVAVVHRDFDGLRAELELEGVLSETLASESGGHTTTVSTEPVCD